ncbi:MAG: DNA topoisomerase (ATP-hydrolyzing) subunit B [Mollicutes bacterium PWAP]|nr:DNA topoisomerase (ATP-hydrolyzing) subunit B [Mollicutes bacterium PWAP]
MSEYGADNIQVLEGLEAVRKRPGMYIGSTNNKGLHHMIWEIVDNSIDEAMAGFADKVKIIITKEGAIRVEDNGRGIPVAKHAKTGISSVETVLTILHAGGKFDSSTYKVSGGLHGVGASVVNALSKYLKVWVKRDKKEYYAEFTKGKIFKALSEIGFSEKTGTTIEFFPDFEIMDHNEFSLRTIVERVKQTAYLNKELKLQVIDERVNYNKEFYFKGGIVEFVNEINKGKDAINEDVIYSEDSMNGDDGDIHVEVAMQYTSTYSANINSYANNIATIEGGSHEKGFIDAVHRILNNYAGQNKIFKSASDKFGVEDIKEGLTAIISIKHPDPIFEGQTKGKLGNKDARKIVNKVFSNALERYLMENPIIATKIINKILLAKKARFNALQARETTRKKSGYDVGSLPGKLADNSSKNPTISEVYIVEGDSAGGSAKMGRDRETQAILPLRGKVINSEKARIDKVFANNEIGSMITALGTGVGEEFNINKLRYHKIIIMTDADVDGAHIRTLLLTFLYRYLRPLIEYGFVYIAQPPLYRVAYNKQFVYLYTDYEKESHLATLPEGAKYTIQRYKGLGEMDPDQLWETTMDPENRKMLQVQIEDSAVSDLTFSILMGDEVEPRRDFINENATYGFKTDLDL